MPLQRNSKVKMDISSCLTFDLRFDLNIQSIHSFNTGHAHLQISGLYCEGNRGYIFNDRE